MSDLDDAARDAAKIIEKLAVDVLGDAGFSHMVWKAAKAYIPKSAAGRPPIENHDMGADGAGRWAARLMIFDPHNDLVADSEPDVDMDNEPAELLPTLMAVGRWAQWQVNAYHAGMHQDAPQGLDEGTLQRRVSSLRVQLSRHAGGLTWWKLPYTVGGNGWHVHVRICKASEEALERGQAPALQPFRRDAPEPAGEPLSVEAEFSPPTD